MYKRSINITRIKKNEKIEERDTVLIESPVDLYINSRPLVNVICLLNDLKELALGFLFSVGIINSMEDVKEINVEELKHEINIELKDSIDYKVQDLELNPVSRVIDTTCGITSPWRKLIKKALDDSKEVLKARDDIKIKAGIIYDSIKEMQKSTNLYRETGGCHGAAIFDLRGNLLGCKEDIGRHNAIDKVIGELLFKKKNFKETILASTGRLTGDSVLKAIRAQIPIVISLSAAVESGIRLAFGYGITLIGFVRGARMNIYTHANRIEL